MSPAFYCLALCACSLLVIGASRKYPSQGSGALALLSKQAALPTCPPTITPKALPSTRIITIAWDYPQTNWTTISNFTIFCGANSGIYWTNWIAGKTLSNTFTIARMTIYLAVTADGTNGERSDYSNEIRFPPPPLTNWVVTLTSLNCTNIQYRDSLRGAWTLLGATNLCVTNPAWGDYRLWRGMGRKPATSGKVFISRTLQ